ncbi:MAG: hypothetical protein V7L27_22115 [Nostoc sp.]|uniref:hypothetical protein n=1 Tax=Nostoc sp. TaxID=1180 RepID=UPI002FF5C69F
MLKEAEDIPDETNFKSLEWKNDWGLGTGDWGLVFLLSTEYGKSFQQLLCPVKEFG